MTDDPRVERVARALRAEVYSQGYQMAPALADERWDAADDKHTCRPKPLTKGT